MTAFAWSEDGGPPRLVWTTAPHGVSVSFSSRAGGVSEGPYESLNLGLGTGDDAERVLRNRGLYCAAVGIETCRTRSLRQVHGTEVHRADEIPVTFADAASAPDGDALWTDTPGVGLVSFGADCLTIVIARADGSCLATAHAGWPGLLAGVIERAAAVVRQDSLVPLIAAIGPSASPSAYEVGPDVARPLVARFGDAALRGQNADLWACGELALRSAGVAHVDLAGLCTITDERFFSHRRTGLPRGVQGVLAFLEERSE